MCITEAEITIEYVELPPYDHLEKEWLDLEARSDASFFISWSWIGCWLACLPAHIKPRLLRATSENGVVGLGLLVSRHFMRHRIFPVRGLFLHATGDATLDGITIEYNGFLVDRSLASVVISRMYGHLAAMFDAWDELHLDGLNRDPETQLQGISGLYVKKDQNIANFVDLREVSLGDGGYLSKLSSKTRYKIRRSKKEFAKQGLVTFSIAKTVDEALEFFSGLKNLHEIHWQSRGLPGAFSNSFFESFHDLLIRTKFNNGEIQLMKARVGDRVIGYLYNFIYRGLVHTYQTGFDYTLCSGQYNLPGLVTHSLAIDYNSSIGHKIYDFMAGDSQYKRMLGTHSRKIDWIILQRDRLKFRLENGLISIKRKLRSMSSVSRD